MVYAVLSSAINKECGRQQKAFERRINNSLNTFP